MPVFFLTTPTSPPEHRLLVDAAVDKLDRKMRLADGQWLIASKGTSVSVSNTLGITGAGEENLITRYPTLIIQVASYFGRANPEVWEWIKANWEATSGG